MSQTPAAIIAALKCPTARREAIIRPYLALVEDVLSDLAIRLQVEDIDRGLLLFWQRQEDFDRSVGMLHSSEGWLRESTWEKGSVQWRITLLKPTEQVEASRVLEAFRTIILGLFGHLSSPEISGIALSFQAPAAIKFLDALRLLFLEESPPAASNFRVPR